MLFCYLLYIIKTRFPYILVYNT